MADRVTGTVAALYVRDNATNIKLDLVAGQPVPKNGYFRLALEHPNYTSLFALAMSAAINRYRLLVRTTGEITSEAGAAVEYLVVEW